MKWTLIFILGNFWAGTALGWTYHSSRKTMNWTEARKWCQTQFTDMVVIQSQEENDYLVSILPVRNKSPYYWIGITKNHKSENWTWIGNNSTWIGERSWAPNEPNNNHSTEFCVEIYVNKGGNRGKWNDEKCGNGKYPVCYQAQCNASSCVRGRCRETINNITCLCEPGFVGDRCEIALKSEQMKKPRSGAFNETMRYSGRNIEPKTVECAPLSLLDNGHLLCSGGNDTFNSTCQLKCYSGFLRIGSSTVTCGVNGVWSGPRPFCTNYIRALFALGASGAFCTICCICFCWLKRRKRKKIAQERLPEETSPSNEGQT